MALPTPGMEIDPERTALLVTDPQNDFLSPDGVTWGLVGENVTEVGTVDNIERLGLDVERVVHVHGGISPYADVLRAAGR